MSTGKKNKTRNEGRIALTNDVIVKGIREVVIRTAREVKVCDSCGKKIKVGRSYARVIYALDRETGERKPMEMFHERCFNDEFTNSPG